MYRIEKKPYGFHISFDGFIKAEEMAQWVKESGAALADVRGHFGVFVDMRNLKPLPQEAKSIMETGQKMYKAKGMQRSVVAVESAVVAMQFKKLAQESGIYEWERYLDVSKTPNWQEVGREWLEKGVDPDKK